MTQEEKDLLLKDLCGRLPYGVKCRTSRKHGLIRIKNCVLDCHWLTEVQNDFYKIKPYLFPLSSMTEEQKSYLYFNTKFDINRFGEITPKVNEDGLPIYTYLEDWVELLYWLNKNHFDYRNLINKNLAIDATNLEIYK